MARPSNAARESREQVTREAESRETFEFDPSVLDEFGPLPNIPARPGYAQRWVRVAIGNEADARNISTRYRRGWRPRTSDSVDKSLHHMLVNREGFGNVIGTHDVILMERPLEIQKKIEAHQRKQVRDLEQAVKHNLFREHKDLGGNQTGFNQPRDESEARVVKGAPRIMED